MKKTIFTLILSLTAFITHGQDFLSEYEKAIFETFKKDTLNYNFFNSLLVIDSTMTEEKASKYRLRVDNILSEFPSKEKKDKAEKKRVANIYNKLHDTFFKKYKLDAYFNEAFTNGNYNCVTATALYSYAFEKLNIPFQVKETPSHVYAIVYPKTFNIHLETTAPGELGFLVPNESEIKKIVNELISYKLATKEEVDEKGYMKFYEEYFYSNEFIDKKSLIGMQYYNKAISLYDAKEYKQSINSLEKSIVFYTSPMSKRLLKNMMFLEADKLEYNSINDIHFFIKTINLSVYKTDYTFGNVEYALNKIANHDDNDTNFITQTITEISDSLKDQVVNKKSIEYLYEYLARNEASSANTDQALIYSDKLYQLNNKSKIAKKIIEYACFENLDNVTPNINSLEKFNQSVDKYPFLKKTHRYNLALGFLYSNIAYQNIKSKKITIGKEYLSKLEYVLDNNPDVIDRLNNRIISELYLKAGNYYYYKDQYKSAHKLYAKGLSYIPDDNELKKRTQWSKQ